MKFSKNWADEATLKKSVGQPKKGKVEKIQSHKEMGFFLFHFFTISYDGN